MEPILDASQTRAREAAAEAKGRSAAQLMEDAGGEVALAALARGAPDGRFFVLCGPGNNGGDGFVAARVLKQRGREVFVELVGTEPGALKGEAVKNFQALENVGIKVGPLPPMPSPRRGDVVVDALFGTGLKRAPAGSYAEAIGRMNGMGRAGASVLAVDLPSGVQSDTGEVFDPCVQADVTVTFGARKVGIALEPGASTSGEVRVVDIGLVDTGERPSAWWVDEADVRGWIPRRSANTHKGTFGHLLVIAGSPGKSGAAAMCAMGALRAGVGLVTVATQAEVMGQVLAHAPEVMAAGLRSRDGLGPEDLELLAPLLEGKQAVVVGPGIPRGPQTAEFLRQLLAQLKVPCLLDADALNVISERPEVLRAAKAPLMLTPHPGEMARLGGTTSADIQAHRLTVARDFATRHQIILVLKGARTLVALPDGNVRVNPTGNPGMATGGTGDVLSGIAGGLLAQGLDPADAATAAVYVHGRAGDLMAESRGQMGLIAADLFEGLCRVWSGWGL